MKAISCFICFFPIPLDINEIKQIRITKIILKLFTKDVISVNLAFQNIYTNYSEFVQNFSVWLQQNLRHK